MNFTLATNAFPKSNQNLIKEKYIKTLNIESFNDFIKKDFGKLDIKLSNMISEINDDKRIETSTFIEIIADKQYQENGLLKAEGNVVVILKNGYLKTDKLIYDRINKIIKAIGNINFSKGKQFFEAKYLEYNSISEKGLINDIYGVIDFEKIDQDLNLNYPAKSNEICNKENIDLTNLPSEIGLLNSSNIRLKNNIGLDAIQFNFSDIKRWRFKTDKIEINNDKWESDLIYFTNDLFNKPQFYLKSKNFSAEEINGKSKLKSKSTFINFDNRLSIPIGRRTISDSSVKPIWGIGYDNDDKDGFFISRNFYSIVDNDYFEFSLRPYFLLQRALIGETNSFRAKDSSVVSKDVSLETNLLDFVAFSSQLKSKIFDGNFVMSADLKTLDVDKFYDAFSLDINYIKNLSTKTLSNDQLIKDTCNYLGDQNNPFKKYQTDLGIYALFEKNNIYTAYGTKIINTYEDKNKDSAKYYSLIFDIGNFKAKSRKNSNELENLDRYSISSSLSHNYKIFPRISNKKTYDESYKYVPQINDQGIFITGNISTGLNQYSNGEGQRIVQASLGPKFVYGEFKNKFFDYTYLSLINEYAFKEGKSPFVFDDFNEDSRLKFGFKQQIIGPLLFGFGGNLNLNNSSEKYGTLESKEYTLGISRRAYSIDLTYNVDQKSILLNFNIFNFGYNRFSPKF